MNAPAVPLIHTALGNLPLAELEHVVRWEDRPDYTKMVETYLYRGEVVRESAHVFARRGLMTESATGMEA
ncbi:MAG TPA: hypothetical protein PKH90_12535 [Candidatus Desulfobacillus denitrificans]|nr:hypothetical protein [Candidatus Desulfobacillus denitrificans]